MAAADGPGTPIDAAATLAWMREHGDVLRRFVAAETRDEDDAPASDGAIRAHLRFAAAALEATATSEVAGPLTGLDEDLPLRFALGEELYRRHVQAGAGAIALEEHLQHGTTPGRDPSLDAALGRRIRISGWIQLFLVQIEERLGPAGDGIASAVTGEMDRRHRDLARLVDSLDNRAKRTLAERITGVPSAAVVDEIGQAATVQAHVRILVEALATALADDGASPSDEAGAE